MKIVIVYQCLWFSVYITKFRFFSVNLGDTHKLFKFYQKCVCVCGGGEVGICYYDFTYLSRFINMFSSKTMNLYTIIRELYELCGNISKFSVSNSLLYLHICLNEGSTIGYVFFVCKFLVYLLSIAYHLKFIFTGFIYPLVLFRSEILVSYGLLLFSFRVSCLRWSYLFCSFLGWQ